MSIETIVLLLVIALVLLAVPAWPYSKGWGYGPTGILTVLLVGFLIWALAGERPLFRRSTLGEDVKSAGQDAADSVRDAVQ